MTKGLIITLLLFSSLFVNAQSSSNAAKPKLVVGIVVDQMRSDYIYRFDDRFGDDGFKRFLNEGYQLLNTHYNYIPTKTAPGHATVYSGATPSIHGVVGNDWYDKFQKKKMYCVEDYTVQGVGTDSKKGQRSPNNLLASTITDELMLTSMGRSKVLSVSMKDRGAVLPAGHMGQAYWLDNGNGKFVTSTFYRDNLPAWINKFNKKGLADKYMKSTWSTLYDINTYTASTVDDDSTEFPVNGKGDNFPYDLSTMKGDYQNIIQTPFGNTLLKEFVLAALEEENLGEDEFTDFLAVSFSSTDYAIHDSGPYSVEAEDIYLRLDKDLEEIFAALDKKVDKGNYLVFLTSDHGVSPTPQYLINRKYNVGYFDIDDEMKRLKADLNAEFGEGNWIDHYINRQAYLNHEFIASTDVNVTDIKNFIKGWMLKQPGVAESYTNDEVRMFRAIGKDIKGRLARGYYYNRSGDVFWELKPAWLKHTNDDATGHKTGYTYDTNVPLLWYGWHIPKGKSYAYYYTTQIAPTLSMMLELSLPNGAMDAPILEWLQD